MSFYTTYGWIVNFISLYDKTENERKSYTFPLFDTILSPGKEKKNYIQTSNVPFMEVVS